MALFQSTFPQNSSAVDDPISQLGLHEYIASQRLRSRQPIGRESSTCTQVVWIFFWLLILVTVAYPVALLAGFLYALVSPLGLIKCCKPFIEFLLVALNFPLTCTKNMVDAKQLIIM